MSIVARSQYDPKPFLASTRSFVGDKGRTKQADAKDCDINAIFKRFEKTGQLPNMIVREPRYGDFSAVPDYQEAMNIVNHAREQFNNLDVSLRNRFENDPAKFLAFATDPKNLDEMEKLGLLNAEAVARREAERNAVLKEQEDRLKAAKAASEQELIARIKAEINR